MSEVVRGLTVRSHVARQQNWLMTVRLKPIKEQVIVITGASSGIGLVTARMAAKRGGRVMLTARNHDVLKQLADEIVAN